MSRAQVLKWGAVVLLASPLLADFRQEGLSPAVLKELKDASAYIKVASGKDQWTGSGFLFRKEGTKGFIATNAHVVDAEAGTRKITVVFQSGTPAEVQVPGEVKAVDYEHDLAVIQVTSPSLPKSIDTRSKQKVKETMILYAVGFPLGGTLAAGAKNPEVTFSKVSISSLRADDSGDVALVQLDGEVNPGNSGGPAVDESGDLVGVVFAKIGGTQIGFAVPAARLDDLIQGRATGLQAEATEVNRTGAKIRVRTELADPFKKIKSVSLLWDRADGAKMRWTAELAQKGMKEQALKLDGTTAWGDVTIPSGGQDHMPAVMQIKLVRGDGVVAYGLPDVFLVDFHDSVTPLDEIRMWQNARPVLRVLENTGDKAKCALEVGLLIPAKAKSASMIVARPASTPRLPNPGPTGVWGRMGGNVQEIPLVLSEGQGAGEFEVKGNPRGGPVTLVIQGQIILEDRRRIFTPPIVQVVPFARPGIARAPSKDDWLAIAATKDRDAGKKPGVAVVADEVALAGEARTVIDATVRKISLVGKDFVPVIVWSADGLHAYLLEKAGKIRMVSVPEFKQVRSLSVGGECAHLAMSKEGLVVHSPALGQIWVLDPATLEFRRKVTAAGLQHFTASPGSSMAFGAANTKLLAIDLASGKVAKQIVAEEYSKANFEKVKKIPGAAPLWFWGWLGLTSDGVHLMVVDRRVHRFRVKGADLAWEEIGPDRRNLKELTLSPDGKYFAALEESLGSVEARPKPGIYSVKDLVGPLVTLPTGASPRRMSLAFDKEAGKLYSAEYGKQVVVYSPKGERGKQYEVEAGADCEFMLAHPMGNRVLLATLSSFHWIEFGN